MMSPSTTHHHPTAHLHPSTGTITASPTQPHYTHNHDLHHDHCTGVPATTVDAKQQLEAANIAHFDAHSEDYDRRHPDARELALRLARALRRVLPLDEDTTSVLDYACGSGQVSRALAPHVARLVGVDISPRMVELYNARADAQGLEPHEMRAVGALAELDVQDRFDLVVCSMAYHHFATIDDVSYELVKYLKPGGTLAVADIAHVELPGDRDDGAPPPPPIMAGYEHIVAHCARIFRGGHPWGVRRCRARERVLRVVHLGQTTGAQCALLPRHRYETGRSCRG
ncbi:S-adenosyl-L-methionine-dependent methyltransferase, partial [Lactarius indigo]